MKMLQVRLFLREATKVNSSIHTNVFPLDQISHFRRLDSLSWQFLQKLGPEKPILQFLFTVLLHPSGKSFSAFVISMLGEAFSRKNSTAS